MALTPHNVCRPGFTLIELMISIAMVVILILGVNTVFQSTLQAVGAGQAFVAATRDGRAAQATLGADLGGAASDGPFFIIHSSQMFAFRNRADLAADKDGKASTYTVTTPDDTTVDTTTANFRSHRLDILTFPARSYFQAQTGNTQFVEPNVASSEARVWYGHLRLPDSTYNAVSPSASNYAYPGRGPLATALTQSTNPNNYFATDWVLGRVATLFVPTTSAATMYIPTTSSIYSPLSDSCQVTGTHETATWQSQDSRCDMAQTSIAAFSTKLTKQLTTTPDPFWSNYFFVGYYGQSTGLIFECNPFITTAAAWTAPAAAAASSRTSLVSCASPYFLKACTQFIVEYAGDFVQQDNDPTSATYSAVKDLVTTNNGKADGIDYVRDPVTGARSVRWYGFPRNPTGAPVTVGGSQRMIPGNTGAAYTPSTSPPLMTAGSVTGTLVNNLTQVVPLRDVVASSSTAVATLNALLAATPALKPAWIERTLPTAAAPVDYGNGGTPAASAAKGPDYLVAWGPDSDAAGIPRPKMIRITMVLDDPSGRLSDGQTFQFVYTLP